MTGQSAEQQAAVELVRMAKERGLSLTGSEGLLKQLTKTVLTEASGQVGIEVPRDRAGTFEPQIVRKRQRWPPLEPKIVVPGHRLPGGAANASAIAATRDYLVVFEHEPNTIQDLDELITAMTARYPDYGLTVSIDIGARVALVEMSWG